MASLRARLLAGLLGLCALGLLVLGGVTYAEQRSFLYGRVDDQLHQARDPVRHALADRAQGLPLGLGFGNRGPDTDGYGPPGGEPPPGRGLPPGTYGERRDAAGNVIGTPVTIAYDQSSTVRPKLPAHITPGREFTVSGTGGGAYRVLASADRGAASMTIVAVPLGDVVQTLHRLLLIEGLVIAGVLLALGLGGFAVVRVGLHPLDRMGHTAEAIAGGDLSHRVEATDPRTEVGRLGISLNRMLDRLEQAFTQRQASEDRLRQFIADASHELRTPLASIRGYAELMRMGAAADPEDVAKATRRIEEEASRMGVLVDDLLTLARLDAVPEVTREPVDVAALARDAADDGRALAPERAIALVPGDGADDAIVLGDEDRLRQVLANLVRNALVHTPAGTPIDIGVARENGDVVVAVRDHGPGLPDGDPAALFERFWRAEGGRTRGRAGAGLGLAIVAGIVDAHGGSVDARNAEGGGARFEVRLPAGPRA